jgi:hypothetical protein
MKKTVLSLLVAATAGLGTQSASAVLITDWSWEVQAAFTAATPLTVAAGGAGSVNAVTPSIPNLDFPIAGPAPAFNFTKLSWGGTGGAIPNPALQSSLQILDPSLLSPPLDPIQTNLGPEDTLLLRHNNFVINPFNEALETATLSAQLLLTPLLPPGASIGPLQVDFQLRFEETLNAGPCPVGVPDCDDIFVVTNPEVITNPVQFVIDDFLYTVQQGALGIGLLPDAACIAAGAPINCLGFITNENSTNDLQAFIAITAVPIVVPEPGVLSLLGAALFGLGALHRRKRKS